MSDVTIDPKKVRPETGALVETGVAAEASDIGSLVVLSTGGWVEANNTTAAGVDGTLGIIVAGSNRTPSGAIASGETISVLVKGPIILGITLTPATAYFTSANAGRIADATSTNARVLGQPMDTDKFLFDPAAANAA